jgi:amino acid adenylation domain-containing protein
MDDSTRARRLADGSNARPKSRPGGSVVELFAEQVRRHPEAAAVLEGEHTLSYAQLDARAYRLAQQLQALDIAPASRIGVCIERSIEEIVAVLAVLRAGCTYVPLDPRQPPERLAHILRDADAAAVIVTRSAERALAAARAGSARPVIVLERDTTGEAATPIAALAPVRRDAPACVMYTSGSTGEPKGVVVPQRAIVRLVRDTDYLQIDAQDVIAHLSNPAFDAATFEVWGALLNGARLAVIPRETALAPTELAAMLDRHGVTALFLTTALFNLVARDAPRAVADRVVLFGGEAVEPRWVAAALAAGPQRLLHVYGPTETTTFATWHEVRAVDDAASTVPIGRPIANTDVYVLDRNREPVPPGIPGEIYIGGPGLADGYLGRPGLTAECFVAHPFAHEPGARLYRTGDRARYRNDGAIEFLGRLDRQVKIRGHRIESTEVEIALRAVPQVRDAVVVVRGDTAETRQLIAYVAVAPGNEPAPADFSSNLRRTLPDYMIPAAIVMLPALPLTGNGKIDRAALPDPDVLAVRRTGKQAAPWDPLEHQIAHIWEGLLGVRDIGVHDNFFDLGGHSLLAAQMMDEIAREIGVSVPLTTLFTDATIVHLARALRSGVQPAAPVVAVRADGTRPPLFFLHGDFSGGGFYCRGLAREMGEDQPFYAVHPHGLGGSAVPESIEAMAEELAAAIRRERPHGPYLVGGHCNGAMIAVEVARRLIAHGERIPLVLLLDAKAPWRPTPVFEMASGNAPARSTRRGIDPMPPATAMDDKAFMRYRRAMAQYSPTRVPVRIAVLHSASFRDFRPNLGWSSVGQDVETHLIPGDHLTSITRHVAETAARMRACIDAALLQPAETTRNPSLHAPAPG